MVEGIILGFMTFMSLVLTFLKLPLFIQNRIKKHKFLADVTAGAVVYLVLGAISKSIVAIVGAIFTGLLVGVTLEAVAYQTPELVKDE